MNKALFIVVVVLLWIFSTAMLVVSAQVELKRENAKLAAELQKLPDVSKLKFELQSARDDLEKARAELSKRTTPAPAVHQFRYIPGDRVYVGSEDQHILGTVLTGCYLNELKGKPPVETCRYVLYNIQTDDGALVERFEDQLMQLKIFK